MLLKYQIKGSMFNNLQSIVFCFLFLFLSLLFHTKLTFFYFLKKKKKKRKKRRVVSQQNVWCWTLMVDKRNDLLGPHTFCVPLQSDIRIFLFFNSWTNNLIFQLKEQWPTFLMLWPLAFTKKLDLLKWGLQVLIVTQGFFPLHIDQLFNRPKKTRTKASLMMTKLSYLCSSGR